MTQASSVRRVGDLTQDQWGLVTRRQLEDAGFAPTTIERLTAPGGVLERVSWGVYQLVGTPVPDHRDLRGAWLQLAPRLRAWERAPEQGVVSHRSAAALYGLGHLPADQHEFTVPTRRQTRRPDVRIHVRPLQDSEWASHGGLLVTRPQRTAVDLVRSREDPEAVAQVVADALRRGHASPAEFAAALAPGAAIHGFRRGDGISLLQWFLDLTGDPDGSRWMDQARVQQQAVP
jgi:predicted transcriptional regulator of viral defense system